MGASVIRTKRAPQPRFAYSQALRAGDFIFTAGFGPHDPETGQVVGETIEEQTRQTLDNLRAVLEAAGADLGDVIKATVHLADLADFERFDRAYAVYFADPKPARTTVGSRLHGFRVEIDLVAHTGQ